MKKQTAVEWLVEKLPTIDKYDPYYADIFQQVKAMENEQIEWAYKVGYNDCSLGRFSDSENYYQHHYGA